MGSRIRRAYLKLAMVVAGVLAVDAAAELTLLPTFYRGVPLPLAETAKPIGGALFNATFFHLTLIVASLLSFAFVTSKLGIDIGLAPRTRAERVDVAIFVAFLLSGLAMWYYPILLLIFIVTGAYLAFIEMR